MCGIITKYIGPTLKWYSYFILWLMSIKREGVSFQIIYNYIHILVEYLWGVSQNLSWLLQWTLCSNLVVNIKDPKHSKDIIFHSLGYITKLYIQYFGQSLFFTIMVNWWSTNQKVFTFFQSTKVLPRCIFLRRSKMLVLFITRRWVQWLNLDSWLFPFISSFLSLCLPMG